MKKYITVFLLLAFTLCLAACSKTEKSTPTGFPNNEVQRVSVYCEGKLYYETGDSVAAPSESASLVGTVQANRVDRYPKEELHAAHVEEGSEVYKEQAEDILYVEMNGQWKIFRELIL